MNSESRALRRWERSVIYGVLGCAVEVAFTGACDALHPHSRTQSKRRDWRLEGHSYLWMLPIYGLVAYLFEPLHDSIATRQTWQRAAAYAAGIMSVEYATGTALRGATGIVPWDYTGHSRFVVGRGAVRLDYAPLWAVAGLGLERVHNTLRALQLNAAQATER